MFFRKDPPQTEGRRDAHPLIKTEPEIERKLITALTSLMRFAARHESEKLGFESPCPRDTPALTSGGPF